MYRILVVDDEEIITDSLARLLKNAMDDALDVYKAYSAPEAMDYLHRAGFDIVVTDIQMPGMSGIELLKQISALYPACKVIFLSGHDEFDYAKQALQYHAARYVLKNEGDDALLAAIADCMTDIEREAHQEQVLAQAHQQLQMCLPLLRREYLNRLLAGADHAEPPARDELARYQVRFDPARPFILLAARLDEHSGEEIPTSIDMLVCKCLDYALHCEMCAAQPAFMLWLVQAQDGTEAEKAAMLVKGMADTLQRTCGQTLNASVSFVLDTVPVVWAEAKARADTLFHAMAYLLGKKEKQAFVYLTYFQQADTERLSGGADALMLQERLQELQWIMQGCDIDGFNEKTAQLKQAVHTIKPEDSLAVMTFCNRLNTLLLSFVSAHGLYDQLAEDGVFRAFMEHPLTGTPAGQLEQFIYLGERMLALWASRQQSKNDAFVTDIDHYIAQHLSEELSLVMLSEKVYLNPSYLSRRYKELTGRNVSDAITQARMRRAAQLLDDESSKIREIGEAVGYVSAAHFSRVFKKQTGQTPQEYRDRRKNVK